MQVHWIEIKRSYSQFSFFEKLLTIFLEKILLTKFRKEKEIITWAKIAKQHFFTNYIVIYHCFENMQGPTTFWVLQFDEIEFSMVLEFHELEYHEKILKIF